MPGQDPAVRPGRSGEFEIVWSAQKPSLSIVVAAPGIVLEAAFSGLLATLFFEPPTAVIVAVSVAVVEIMIHVISWLRFAGRRVVSVSDGHLAVCLGDKTETELLWADIESVALLRGDSLLRLNLDFTLVGSDLPRIVATPKDRWSTAGTFPALLAFLPSEFNQLGCALQEQCNKRSVPFSIQ